MTATAATERNNRSRSSARWSSRDRSGSILGAGLLIRILSVGIVKLAAFFGFQNAAVVVTVHFGLKLGLEAGPGVPRLARPAANLAGHFGQFLRPGHPQRDQSQQQQFSAADIAHGSGLPRLIRVVVD